MLVRNDVKCNYIYRIVKNEDILKERISLPNISYLKYPSKEIVKQVGMYNRANTPDFNVFYGAESINAALLETQPAHNDLITIGIWKNISKDNKVVSYPISHGKEAIEVNEGVRKGYQSFLSKKKNNSPLLMDFMELIFDFLGSEFSKSVENHFGYFYSAIYSERIFNNNHPDWIYNAIIYPSVKNRFKYENLAIRPEFFDANFQIERIWEMVIDETYYSQDLKFDNPVAFSYVKPLYIKEPKQIGFDGSIIW